MAGFSVFQRRNSAMVALLNSSAPWFLLVFFDFLRIKLMNLMMSSPCLIIGAGGAGCMFGTFSNYLEQIQGRVYIFI